jgi:DNA-binding transcriptional LysR family regulator
MAEAQMERTTGRGRQRQKAPASAVVNVAPDMSQFSVEYLLFFRAVANNLSFTKAARELSIDQSWLSHKIRQFEEMLGISLFIRNTRHVELTAAGRILLEPVHRLSTVVEEARAVTKALQESMSGMLRVGCLPFSFPDPQRTRIMDEFVSHHENIRLNVTCGPTPVLLDHLRMGTIDLAFVSAPFDDADLDMLLLRENHFCMLVPKDHSLANRQTICREDVDRVRIVVPAQHYNPATYDLYYRPMEDSGAVVESIPEFQNAAAYALDRNLPVVCTRFAADRYDHAAFVRRPINFLPPCRKYLVRLANRHTPSQQLMWKMAEDMLAMKKAA